MASLVCKNLILKRWSAQFILSCYTTKLYQTTVETRLEKQHRLIIVDINKTKKNQLTKWKSDYFFVNRMYADNANYTNKQFNDAVCYLNFKLKGKIYQKLILYYSSELF